jgi:glyoxylase-like metal-dependent hydrolase (beta-lactamase superfamily II)
MWKEEWDFWSAEKVDLAGINVPGEIKMVLVDSARKALPLIKAQVNVLECETEIVPGVHAVSAPGHTPGHTALIISSGHMQLLALADVVLYPIHLDHPSWRTVFDFAQDRVAETRRELLIRAAAGGTAAVGRGYARRTSGLQKQVIDRPPGRACVRPLL